MTTKRIAPLLAASLVFAFVGVRIYGQPRPPREIPFAPTDAPALEGFDARQAALNKEFGEFVAYVRSRERVAGNLSVDRARRVWIDIAPSAAPVDSSVAPVSSVR